MVFRSRHKSERQRRATAIGAGRPAVHWKFKLTEATSLQTSIHGQVVLPTDDDYHAARQGYVFNFQCFPQIIVYCEVFSDVAACLEFARKRELRPVCRASGHNTAGYSGNDQMVIDVSRLNQVVIDPKAKHAYLGPGANFGRINAMLDTYQLHMPGGGCDDVTIGGYLQCGGYGFTSLMYGMNCDCLLEATVMLADGTIVIADPHTNHDLFWAIRGGTGNNFGILLEAKYQLFDLYECWGFGLRWELPDIGEALHVLQRDFTGAKTPKDFGYQCTLGYVHADCCLIFRAIHQGTHASCKQLMQPLLAIPGVKEDIKPEQGSYTSLNNQLNSDPLVPDVPDDARELADSRYIERQLSASEWQELAQLVAAGPNRTNFVGVEPYGGKIAAVDPSATAFAHRTVAFDVYTWVFWFNSEEETASRFWLQQLRDLLQKLGNGHAYQGYPNRDSTDFRELYWGQNFATLLAIKQKYDPTNLFAFEQGVTPIPEDAPAHVRRPPNKVLLDVSKPIERTSFGKAP